MKITIIGAGPGGLICARILQRHGVAVTVYDSDEGPHSRDQGGTLDLREDDGQLALREAGLLDDFDRLARPEGQEMRELSPAGEVLGRHVPEPDEREKPEIDRGQLRDLLLGSLEPGTVRWGARLRHTSPDGTLTFEDGVVVRSDLVIGADGAFSKVRPAVSGTVPEYTGVSFTEAWFDDVDHRHPDLAALVGPGGAAAADGTRGLFAQRNSGDHIRVYLIQRVDLGYGAGDSTEALRTRLLEAYAGWAPSLRALISENDGEYITRPLFVLPVPHTWEHNPHVTLLGDAAHLMPPVGVGANLAMLDACELALALVNSASIADAVATYEKTMLPRSADFAAQAATGPAGLLGED